VFVWCREGRWIRGSFCAKKEVVVGQDPFAQPLCTKAADVAIQINGVRAALRKDTVLGMDLPHARQGRSVGRRRDEGPDGFSQTPYWRRRGRDFWKKWMLPAPMSSDPTDFTETLGRGAMFTEFR